MSNRNVLIQNRFQEFIKALSTELNEPIMGSVVSFHFAEDVEFAVTVANSPVPLQMRLIDNMSGQLARAMSRLKATINTKAVEKKGGTQ